MGRFRGAQVAVTASSQPLGLSKSCHAPLNSISYEKYYNTLFEVSIEVESIFVCDGINYW